MATISKKFGQFKQWTGEKFGSTGKTETSEDFKRLEEETERRKEGIERIHSSLAAYVKTLDKKKVSKLDPLRGRHLPIESFGSSLLSQGRIIGDTSNYGKNLLKAGDIQHRLAAHQLEFMSKAKSTYLMQLDTLIELIKEYQHLKKKLSNRRLDYDAKLNRVQKSKKERPEHEEEMKTAQLKYEETLSDMKNLMKTFSEKEAEIGAYLVLFLDAQLAYFQKNVEALNENSQLLRDSLVRGTGASDLYHNSMHSLSNSSLNGSAQSLPMVPKDPKNGLYTPASLDEIKAKADQRASLPLPAVAPPAYSSSSIDGGAPSGPTTSASSQATLSSSSPSSRPSLHESLLSNDTSRVRVLYSFTKENDDELSIKKGESLSVLEMVDEGWWVGKNEAGQVGLFPSNYVEILPQSNTPSRAIDKKSKAPAAAAAAANSAPSTSNGSSGGKRGGEEEDEGEGEGGERGSIGSGGRVSQISESAPANQNISNVNASYKEAILEKKPSAKTRESREDLMDSIDSVIAQKGPLQAPATFHAKVSGGGLASKSIGKSNGVGLGDMMSGSRSSQKNQPQTANGPCAECSCDDYSPNVFKAGSCNNCFHRH